MTDSNERKELKFPRIWENKESKKRLRVMPWWESEDPIMTDADAPPELAKALEGRKFKIGCLVQVGWLLENEANIWFGIGLKADKFFDDVTDEEEKKDGTLESASDGSSVSVPGENRMDPKPV